MSNSMEPAKRSVSEAEINEFLSSINKKRLLDREQTISADDIASISYQVANLVQAVETIVNLPSKYEVDEFKSSCVNKTLLYGLQDPAVIFGLDLKQVYDMGQLPIFDKFRSYDERILDNIKPDPIIQEFLTTSHQFLPPIPVIKDLNIKRQFEEKQSISNLLAYGRRYYDFIVAEIIQERFPDREIEEITMYTEDRRIPSHWNKLYNLQGEDDVKTIFHEYFYAFIGALATSEQKNEVKTWLTILLESLFIHLDNGSYTTEDAIEKLKVQVPEAKATTLFNTTVQSKPLYLVRYGFGSMVLGIASGSSEEEAQAKIASSLLYNSSIIDKIHSFAESLPENDPDIAPVKNSETASINTSGSPVAEQRPKKFGEPQLSQQHLFNQRESTGPVKMEYDQSSIYHTQQQSQPIKQASAINTVLAHDPSLPVDESVYRCDDPKSDAEIDMASKERLNTFLIGKKLPPAEYKTSKVNNSEVQVVCYLNSKPVARASGTNKKKAGQWVAKNVLEYIEYFLLVGGLSLG